ncbi:MAG: hypothetical protein LBP72_03785 [Dysgonamonadaceae bacterium]|jgi:hypothetical protein|nr:hypothetical protein [Dysgonamonadaceae bacterium]
MSKNKDSKQNQPLSAEKYIRQKAVKLPVYKCWINEDWEKSRLACIVIARQHTTGNVTACIYYADLGCLGIKDSYYLFNVPVYLLMEKIDTEEVKFIETSYELAHNIIYSALEYAEELGFEPHRDFTQTTRFFLEEDTDDIPLIEIPCGGSDGKPLYINSIGDSPTREKQILNQLKKAVGEGNYHYFLNLDDDFDEEDEYDDDDDDDAEMAELKLLTDKFSVLENAEQKKLLAEFVGKRIRAHEFSEYDENNKEDIKAIYVLSTILMENEVTPEEVDEQKEILEKRMSHPLVDADEFPNSLLAGIPEGEEEATLDLFFDTFDAIMDEDEDAKTLLETFQKQFAGKPLVCFLELFYWKGEKKTYFVELLETYSRQYPDYFLIQLINYQHLLIDKKYTDTRETILAEMETLLANEKQPITYFEYSYFLYILLIPFTREDGKNILAKVKAFEDYIIKSSDYLDEQFSDYMLNSLTMLKIIQLTDGLDDATLVKPNQWEADDTD